MNVFVDTRLVRVLVFVGGVERFSVGADLSDGVEVCAGRAGETVGQAAVTDETYLVVDSRTALNEPVRPRRVRKQRARVIDALVITRILSDFICSPITVNKSTRGNWQRLI